MFKKKKLKLCFISPTPKNPPPSKPVRQLHGPVRGLLGVHGAGLAHQPLHRLPPYPGDLQRCLLRRGGRFVRPADGHAGVQLERRVRQFVRQIFVRAGGGFLRRDAPEAVVEGPVGAEQFPLFEGLRQAVVERFRQPETGEAAGDRDAAHDDQREDEVFFALEGGGIKVFGRMMICDFRSDQNRNTLKP